MSGDPADDVLRRVRVGRESNAQCDTGCRRAHRLQHREQEASRLGPLVFAPVEPGREELCRQVLVRGRDLDPVQPRLRNQRGAPRVAFDDLLDLARGQRARLHVEAKAGNRRGRERRRPRRVGDLLAAAVEELHEEPRSVRLHGLGDSSERRDDLLAVAAQRVRRQEP